MLFLLLFVAFFLGSIPCGYIAGRLRGIDIRKQGSGNTGATNASRVLGKKIGLLVLFCDALKGVVALWLGETFLIDPTPLSSLTDAIAALGFTALLGHCFSPFLNFRGGKGVATAAGVFLYLTPTPAILTVSIFLICLRTTGYVSLSSLSGAIILPLLVYYSPNNSSFGMVVVALLSGALIIIRHQSNIRRLFRGEESKFSLRSKTKA